MWAMLLVTLPTHPNAVRLRIWRALKAMGCAALRDGAYLLTADHAERLATLAAEVREHGGAASVYTLAARDDAQRDEIVALFDRSQAYAEWRTSLEAAQAELADLSETDARRRLRALGEALGALRAIDYYPGPAAAQAASDLQALRTALEARFSKGEPAARAAASIERLDVGDFQRRRWATRARPWVDRLACAWLIRRFIDPQAELVWLADASQPPRDVIGYDYDGARFSHVGTLVSFEVLAASFGLDADARLRRIAQTVRYLDVGGIPVPEAAGLEAILAGLREIHADDHRLAAAAAEVFDAYHASPGANP
jgi:hypothetical protein